MNGLRMSLLAGAASLLFVAAHAQAQTAGSETQRDVNQQQRIEQGLQSGTLTPGEASRLERGESRINRMESNALKNGNLSPAERELITRAQNAESGAINRLENNRRTANPNSPSSRRMEADVQRDVNQERRTEQGISSGSLTNREVGKIERGAARTDRAEAAAGANGRIGAGEQRRIQRAENNDSRRITREQHDNQTR